MKDLETMCDFKLLQCVNAVKFLRQSAESRWNGLSMFWTLSRIVLSRIDGGNSSLDYLAAGFC